MYAQGLQNDLIGITDQALSDSATTQQANTANLQALTQLSMVQAQNSNARIESQLNQLSTFVTTSVDTAVALVYTNMQSLLISYKAEILQDLNQLALQDTSSILQVQASLNKINGVISYLQYFVGQMGVIWSDNARVMGDVVSELTSSGDLPLHIFNAIEMMNQAGENPFVINIGVPPLNLSIPTTLM